MSEDWNDWEEKIELANLMLRLIMSPEEYKTLCNMVDKILKKEEKK